MSDPQSENPFGNIPLPPVDPIRRQQTIDLAMAAFDVTQTEKVIKTEKNKKTTQGFAAPRRLSIKGDWLSVVTEWIKGNMTMERKYWLASVAVGALAVIAVPSVLLIQHPDFAKQTSTSTVNGAAVDYLAANTLKEEVGRTDTLGRKNIPEQEIGQRSNETIKDKKDFQVQEADQATNRPATPQSFAAAPAELKAAGRVESVAKLASPARMQIAPTTAADAVVAPGYQDFGRDQFIHQNENQIKMVAEAPVSTFSIDVDSAAYSYARRQIMQGTMPAKDSVRVEEMINYFPYDYPAATDREQPFEPTVAVYPSPWNSANKLVHIGIKGHQLAEKRAANLVFLIDVSGSMNSTDKLPLLKNAFRLMVDNLNPDDRVGIVVYAGSAGAVLEPTQIKDKQAIFTALENLSAGGSTAGGEGIRKAYAMAKAHFDPKAVNRVILATDGDFNVGITNQDELQGFIERERDSGVFLSVLGFGTGNYNDALMQKLAQNGNGVAAYIDTLSEARKVLVEEASSTLYPIAKDVKIQVEFNPDQVASYRLIGYESRMLNRADFNNDKIDAGEIGAGHTVTALYEITPVGAPAPVDGLRYQQTTPEKPTAAKTGELAFLKMRYKLPNEDKSRLIERPIGQKDVKENLDQTSDDIRFAAAVAGFGQLLTGGHFTGTFGYDDVVTLAENAKGKDRFGYRAEFVNLARLAKQAAALPTQP